MTELMNAVLSEILDEKLHVRARVPAFTRFPARECAKRTAQRVSAEYPAIRLIAAWARLKHDLQDHSPACALRKSLVERTTTK